VQGQIIISYFISEAIEIFFPYCQYAGSSLKIRRKNLWGKNA